MCMQGSICQTCHAIQIHLIFPQFGMVVCGARVEIDVIFNSRTSRGFLCLRHCFKSLASSRLVGNGCATSLVSESNATLRLMFLLVIHVFRMLLSISFISLHYGKAMATQKFYTLAETSNFYSTQHVCDVGSSQHVSCDTIAAAWAMNEQLNLSVCAIVAWLNSRGDLREHQLHKGHKGQLFKCFCWELLSGSWQIDAFWMQTRWSEEFVLNWWINLGCQACIPQGASRKGFCFEVLLSSHSTSLGLTVDPVSESMFQHLVKRVLVYRKQPIHL